MLRTRPSPFSRLHRLALIVLSLVGLIVARGWASNEIYDGWAQAARGLPLFSAFEVPPTRHNGEVWAFTAGDDGQLWIGSDELSLFDGKTRERIELPSGTYAVRALARDATGRLWLGSIDEIGYLDRTATGVWRYVSMREQLRSAGIDQLRDVWFAADTARGMVFVTEQRVLRWNGSGFEHWEMPSATRLFANRDGATLWIFQSGKGIFRMEADGPRLTIAASALPSAFIFWTFAASHGDASEVSPEVVGSADGVFRREGNGWTKLPRLSAKLAEKIPWHAVRLDARTVAIGSYLGGVTIASLNDQVFAHLDRSTGLPHDSVTGLWFDGASRLWAGFPGGTARIEARGLASAFTPQNGLSEPALKVLSHRGETNVLTRRMLMRLANRSESTTAGVFHLTHLQTPLSDAISAGDSLLFSGYGGGVWKFTQSDLREIAALPGYIFSLMVPRQTEELLLLRDTRIETLSINTPTDSTPRTVADLNSYPINFAQDGRGDVWVSTVTNGIFQFRRDPASTTTSWKQAGHFRRGAGVPNDAERPHIAIAGRRVFALTERTILHYEENTDTFVETPELRQFIALAAVATDDPATAYWLVRAAASDGTLPPVLLRVRADDRNGSVTWTPFEIAEIATAGRINAVSFTPDDGGTLWLSGSRTLLRVSLSQLVETPPPPPVTLGRFDRNDRPVALPATARPIAFEADTTVLRVTLAGARRASGDNLLVQSSLSGLSEQWLKPQIDPVFTFTGLRPGNYTFRARAIDQFGRTGPALAVTFSIAAPWYQRGPAMAGYVALAALVIFGGVRWRLRQLRRQNDRLNAIVDERTRELARANLVKNEFLENISHEIRNPLNGIANLVDLLRDAPLPAEERRLALSLRRSTEHLKRVFEDVLGYTRLEYGHLHVDLAPFSLVELLEDVLALHRVDAREKKTDLSLHVPASFVDGFRGDSEKIRTIVSNYVSNALKYAPGAPVRVEVISTTLDTSDRVGVRIAVVDSGPGLSASEQAQLFEKFSRGARAKASGISGTGLGLAICRGLAELMDGQAGVTSAPGQGATFWIDLPLERATFRTKIAPDTGAVGLEGTRALIVDDQEYNQTVLRGMVRKLGLDADVASCAEEVWPLVERHAYSTIFLDWELPRMNGGEIARKLRSFPATRGAVVIATTAHDKDDIRQQCLEAQMDGFAVKPLDPEKLRSVLAAAKLRSTRSAILSTPAELARASVSDTPHGTELNFEAFRYFSDGDPAHAAEASTRYVSALDGELTALRNAAERGDREAVARAAHRVRSHASIVNAVVLTAAAQRVVTTARDPSSNSWNELIAPVFAAADALRTAIISRSDHPTEDV